MVGKTIRLNNCLQEVTYHKMDGWMWACSLQMGEVLEETDWADELYQCAVCGVFCFLSQIMHSCVTKVVCIGHHNLLCRCLHIL